MSKRWMIKEVSFINVTRQMGPEVEVLSVEIDLDDAGKRPGRAKIERVALSDKIVEEIIEKYGRLIWQGPIEDYDLQFVKLDK